MAYTNRKLITNNSSTTHSYKWNVSKCSCGALEVKGHQNPEKPSFDLSYSVPNSWLNWWHHHLCTLFLLPSFLYTLFLRLCHQCSLYLLGRVECPSRLSSVWSTVLLLIVVVKLRPQQRFWRLIDLFKDPLPAVVWATSVGYDVNVFTWHPGTLKRHWCRAWRVEWITASNHRKRKGWKCL